ncbi:MAG: cellulase family glycosylhydrolase [Treponema sp.]|nr:glycoside hydrolase family 5 protein [Spirochaetia bacterium]MDY2840454.1 cellulase family glycosylhydrolase [Treponema sp.]MDY5123382.1 cellulase family glycosylhydrolase [Treponema sp.]
MLELKQGINLGGWFSQTPPDETHYNEFITIKDIEWIASHNFDHIRLPVDYDFLETQDCQPVEAHYELIKKVIYWCKAYNLKLVLDLHKAYGYDFNTDSKKGNTLLFSDKEAKKRFISLWKTIAEHFKSYDFVAFELLNQVVNLEYASAWDKLAQKTTKQIRKIAKNNTIIYGGVLWNSAETIGLLSRPKDKNVMFTFHYYEPLLFTHQRAEWITNMPDFEVLYPDNAEFYQINSVPIGVQAKSIFSYRNKEKIAKYFHSDLILKAFRYSNDICIPLYCGEFGVIDKAPVESTLNWFKDVISVLKSYGIGYAVWNYKDMNFGISGSHYTKLIDEFFTL